MAKRTLTHELSLKALRLFRGRRLPMLGYRRFLARSGKAKTGTTAIGLIRASRHEWAKPSVRGVNAG